MTNRVRQKSRFHSVFKGGWCMPHTFFMQLSGFAFVLEGQLHARAICRHFAVLDFQIGLYNFGNAQIAQCSSSRLDCISCGILPGFRTRADYLRYFIYGVCSLCLFWHIVSFLLLLLPVLPDQFLAVIVFIRLRPVVDWSKIDRAGSF